MEKPMPIYITREEGGKFVPFAPGKTGGTAHSIFFEDGSVFDCLNGWRTGSQLPIEEIHAAYERGKTAQ